MADRASKSPVSSAQSDASDTETVGAKNSSTRALAVETSPSKELDELAEDSPVDPANETPLPSPPPRKRSLPSDNQNEQSPPSSKRRCLEMESGAPHDDTDGQPLEAEGAQEAKTAPVPQSPPASETPIPPIQEQIYANPPLPGLAALPPGAIAADHAAYYQHIASLMQQQQLQGGHPPTLLPSTLHPGTHLPIPFSPPTVGTAPDTMPQAAGAPAPSSSRASHICPTCNQTFSRAHDLKRHSTTHTGEKAFQCTHCGRKYARKDALKRHACGGAAIAKTFAGMSHLVQVEITPVVRKGQLHAPPVLLTPAAMYQTSVTATTKAPNGNGRGTRGQAKYQLAQADTTTPKVASASAERQPSKKEKTPESSKSGDEEHASDEESSPQSAIPPG